MAEFTEAESKLVREALAGAPEGPPVKSPGDRARDAHAQGHAALKSAEKAARRNDLAAAKQWTATAKRMADIADQLANTPLPEPSWEEEEAIRQQLVERFAKFCGDDDALNRWRMRREIWEEMAAEAHRTGASPPPPMPPRPPHWADALPEDVRRRVLGE
jgi:hypothetical protein